MMQYVSLHCKEANGISRIAILGFAARLAILLVILLIAACGDDSGNPPNPDIPFPESSNADLADLSFPIVTFRGP